MQITQRGAHTEEELMVATTLSTISRSNTIVIDPKSQVPSQAYEGNLETLPRTPLISPPPGGKFLAPLRDLSSPGKTGEVDRQLDHDSHDESRLALIAGTNAGRSESFE